MNVPVFIANITVSEFIHKGISNDRSGLNAAGNGIQRFILYLGIYVHILVVFQGFSSFTDPQV